MEKWLTCVYWLYSKSRSKQRTFTHYFQIIAIHLLIEYLLPGRDYAGCRVLPETGEEVLEIETLKVEKGRQALEDNQSEGCWAFWQAGTQATEDSSRKLPPPGQRRDLQAKTCWKVFHRSTVCWGLAATRPLWLPQGVGVPAKEQVSRWLVLGHFSIMTESSYLSSSPSPSTSPKSGVCTQASNSRSNARWGGHTRFFCLSLWSSWSPLTHIEPCDILKGTHQNRNQTTNHRAA